MKRFHHFLHVIFAAYVLIALVIGVSVVQDFAVADTTSTLRPTADGGEDSADWSNTGSTACNATDCYTEVDESSGGSCTNSDGDTSYIETSANGADQTFNIDLSSITNNSTITQIDITVCAVRGAGGAKIQTRRCVDGTCTSSGSDINLGGSYAETTQSHTSLSITKEAGTDIEIGVENSAAKTARVSQISAVVTYTPPDTTAPDAVSDLALSDASDTAITASWTAPGDDGSSGTATTYDLRYSTSAITAGNFSSATQVTGEPSPSVAGTSESMTVSGLSASTLYYFAMKTDDEVPNTSDISNLPSLSTTVSGGSPPPAPAAPTIPESSSGGVTPTRVVFSGRAYPGSSVEVLRRGSLDDVYSHIPIENSSFESDGSFSVEVVALLQGQYFFALRFSDKDGRETGILSFDVNLASTNNLVAEKLFIPPTLGMSETVVQPNKSITFTGYAASHATVDIDVDQKVVGMATAGADGLWKFTFTTDNLVLGNHFVRVLQRKDFGTQNGPDVRTSSYTSPRTFKVSTLSFPRADFNNDGVITITDWSIFLFRWASSDTSLRAKLDMNEDGKITIADFSVFLRAMKI